MASQTLLLVDRDDKLQGYATRRQCHLGRGRRHRAFVTLLFDGQSVLLHRRRHQLFDGLWDLTAISHPLRINGRNETYQQASDRALRKEMGISSVPIKNVGGFNYFARDGKNCENEYCAVLLGDYSGKIRPNKNEVYEFNKVSLDNLFSDIKKYPKKYTPWARLAVKTVLGKSLNLKSEKMNNFTYELSSFRKIFEPYQVGYFLEKIKEAADYPPLIKGFYQNLADFNSGGKKLRAFLVYLGYKIAGGYNSRKILPISLAYELVHSFFLIHDDIIDESDMRRGKPTIHERYGQLLGGHYGLSQAIVLGDIAFFEAQNLINSSDFDSNDKIICQKAMLKTACETGYGQALDIEYSHKGAKLGDIWQMIQLKTAKYSFVGPLVIGALFGKLAKGRIESLYKFGLAVGQAFQIQDDILGVFGDEKLLGKSVLSDLCEGKNTLLVHKSREFVKGQDKKDLARIWGKRNADMADLIKVRRIFEKSRAREWCEDQKYKLVKVAKIYINQATKNQNIQKILNQMADFVIERKS